MDDVAGLVIVAIVVWVLPALVVAVWASSRLRDLEQQQSELHEQFRDLSSELTRLLARQRPSPTDADARPAPERAAAAPAAEPEPAPAAAVPAPPAPAEPAGAVEGAPEPPPEPARPAAPLAPPAPPPAAAPAAEPAAAPPPRPAPAAVPPSPPGPPPPPPEPPAPPTPAFDWESLVGVKLFSAVAGIALVIAAVFFLRYSIEQGWLQPPVRVAIGVLVGLGLLIACELKAARKYPVTANALDAAAVTVLYATFFSAHALWNLIPVLPTYGLLVLVTVTAVALSIRRDSLFIAVLGLLGGFAVPALLSTGENRPVTLFSYLLFLNLGLAWVANRKHWWLLTTLTLVLTTLYQGHWVLRFLSASQMPLAIAIFLLFPVVTFLGLVLRPGPSGDDADAAATRADTRRTALAAAAVPLLFAVYLASVPAYGAHAGLLFGFLLVVDLGLLVVALVRRMEMPHVAGAVTTLVVFAIWLAVSYRSAAMMAVLLALTVAVGLYLLAPEIARRWSRPFEDVGRESAYAAPLLLFVVPVLAWVEPSSASPAILFGLLFVLAGVIAWRAIAAGPSALYFVAAFFAVAAEAAWSAAHLTPERLGTAVLLYGALGAFYLGVPVLARRWSRPLEPVAGGGMVLLASLALLLFLAAGRLAPEALWALAFLLAILNAGLFVESAATKLPALSIAGSLLSWVVIGVWWTRAASSVGVLPSLVVVALLALVMLAGHARMRASLPPPPPEDRGAHLRADAQSGIYLAFIGHFFLAIVAVDPGLGIPPGPLFGVLALLTLATSALSLAVRSGALHALGVAAAGIVLVLWSGMASAPPWPDVGLVSAEALVVYAAVFLGLARRAGLTWMAALGLGAALAGAEIVAMSVSAPADPPPIAALVGVHAVNLTGMLAVAWRTRLPMATYGALALGWLGVLVWQDGHPAAWAELLAVSTIVYLVFVVYPFVLGRSAAASRHPYLAAVISSGAFLLAARHALVAGGYGWLVGAVPVAEAAVMALLLRQLLGTEPAGERDLGRLAVVAGAALALVTVAIPLQLREHWITIGWALEGAALAWLYQRVPHRGLLDAAAGLLGVVFVRLVLPTVLLDSPRGDLPVFNWYLYTFAVSAAAFITAGWWLSKTSDSLTPALPRCSQLAYAAGAITLFLLLNIEIADFYATGPQIEFGFGVTLAQDLTYTIGWLVFGMLLLAVGIYVGSQRDRIAAIGLITVTAVKGFLYDLSSLGGLYRVASFVGLAMCLSLVALALQRWVLSRSREET